MKIKTTSKDMMNAMEPFAKAMAKWHRLVIRRHGKAVTLTDINSDTQLTMALAAESDGGDWECAVEFRLFKETIERAKAENIEIELHNNALVVCGNGAHAADIPALDDDCGLVSSPKDADRTQLPTGFAGFLCQSMQAASREASRIALRGIHLSSRGLAGCDGRQLCSIPLPLASLRNAVILPPSPLYSALHRLRWQSLSHWEAHGAHWIEMAGAEFSLTVKAIDAPYPNYWSVFPDASSMDIKATLQGAPDEAAMAFLKIASKGGGSCIGMKVHGDRIELSDSQGRHESIIAKCDSRSLPAGLKCNAAYLLQALRLGHTTFEFNSRKNGPIVSSGGSGRYLFMPMDWTTSPSVRAAQENTSTDNQKEKNKMITPIQITTAKAPAATAEPQQKTSNAEPLTELSSAIAAIRERLDEMQARLNEAGRRIREAIVQQKQKERVYLETSRKLEKIRMAV